jgi:hypothetical protein
LEEQEKHFGRKNIYEGKMLTPKIDTENVTSIKKAKRNTNNLFFRNAEF